MEKSQQVSSAKSSEINSTNVLSRSMDHGRPTFSKGFIKRRCFICTKKEETSSSTAKSLEMQCKEAIQGQTGINPKALIEQIYSAIKAIHQGQPTFHSLESLQNCIQQLLKSNLLGNLVGENDENLKLLVSIACSKGGCSSKVKFLCFNILDVISSSFIYKHNIIEIEFIHKFLDSLLAEEIIHEEKLRILNIIINLMKYKEGSSYIPGETLIIEQHRVNMIQFGALMAIIYLSKNSNVEIKNLTQAHLGANYFLQELEWSLSMLLEYSTEAQKVNLLEEKEFTINSKYLLTVPRPRMQLNQYADLWNGKHMILTPQYKELVKEIVPDLEQFIKIRRKSIDSLECQKLRNKVQKIKFARKLKEDQIIESEIRHTEEIHALFKRYDHTQHAKGNLLRQDIREKQKQMLNQEKKNKIYLAQIQKQPGYNKPALPHIVEKPFNVTKRNKSALRSNRKTIFSKEKKSENKIMKHSLNETYEEANTNSPIKKELTPIIKQSQTPSSLSHRVDLTKEEKAWQIYSIYHNESYIKKTPNLVKPKCHQGSSARNFLK